MSNIKKYLPSKQFVASILVIVIVFSFAITIKELFTLIKRSTHVKDEPTKVTIKEVVEQDSNNNGIADWEEYLWGLDPTRNGAENKEFILAKKKSLAESGAIGTDNNPGRQITDNELMSRELFATIIALQGSGQLTEEAIATISDNIGQKIVPEEIPDKYTANDITVVQDSQEANKLYHGSFVNIYAKYQDKNIGEEMTIISQGIANNDAQAMRSAKTIASYYRDFAQELLSISVPVSIRINHLNLVNSLIKIADSVDGLSMSLADEILGMKSIIQYNKYSSDFVSNLEEISNVLQLSQ